jgi:hypothetical protein
LIPIQIICISTARLFTLLHPYLTFSVQNQAGFTRHHERFPDRFRQPVAAYFAYLAPDGTPRIFAYRTFPKKGKDASVEMQIIWSITLG